MSATADHAEERTNPAGRLGFEPGQVVQEIGFDDDVDHELREGIESLIGQDLVDEDYDDVADVVLLWFRDEDGDLTDALVDAIGLLEDGGMIWLLTPKTGRDGYVEPSDISDAAQTAGLSRRRASRSGRSGRARVWPRPSRSAELSLRLPHQTTQEAPVGVPAVGGLPHARRSHAAVGGSATGPVGPTHTGPPQRRGPTRTPSRNGGLRRESPPGWRQHPRDVCTPTGRRDGTTRFRAWPHAGAPGAPGSGGARMAGCGRWGGGVLRRVGFTRTGPWKGSE